MKEGELTPFEELVIPPLKARQVCYLHPRGLVLFPLLLFAWRLTNPSLYSTEISLALVDSSRAMGNTHQQFITVSVMSWTKKWVKDGSVLYEQGTLAADGCEQVGTGSQLIMIILLLVGLFTEEILLLFDQWNPERHDCPWGGQSDGSDFKADFKHAADKPLPGTPDGCPREGEGKWLLQQPHEKHW